MSKAYKFLVVNTKGGVGKSTVCAQALAPYLYSKTKTQTVIYEFDDENRESRHFGASKVLSSFAVPCSAGNLRDEITEILINDETVCIDVAAGKTAKTLVEAVIDSGLLFRVDLVVIPLMDGEIDAQNALEVYETLKAANGELKAIFALGRVNTARDLHCQFDNFFGDQRGLFASQKGILPKIAPEDRVSILMHDADVIKYSRMFGVTVWEIAHMAKDLGAELQNAVKNKEPQEKIKMLSFKHSLKKDSIEYVKNTLNPAFKQIDKRLKEEA